MIRMNFSLDLGAARAKLKDKVLLAQKKISFDLLEGVVVMTPVDTGRAKGNWFVSLGAPILIPDWERLDPGGSSTVSLGNVAIQRAQTYGPIYLTNNLPYIVALEKGHSRQAPAGMVRVTLDRVAAGLG